MYLAKMEMDGAWSRTPAQLRWLWHLVRMPPWRLPFGAFGDLEVDPKLAGGTTYPILHSLPPKHTIKKYCMFWKNGVSSLL